jgi:hypothetical protein
MYWLELTSKSGLFIRFWSFITDPVIKFFQLVCPFKLGAKALSPVIMIFFILLVATGINYFLIYDLYELDFTPRQLYFMIFFTNFFFTFLSLFYILLFSMVFRQLMLWLKPLLKSNNPCLVGILKTTEPLLEPLKGYFPYQPRWLDLKIIFFILGLYTTSFVFKNLIKSFIKIFNNYYGNY